MAKAYSNDLRRKLLEAYDRGEGSLPELAERFGVSTPWAWKISAQRRRTGQMERVEQRHGPRSKVTGAVAEQLRRWIGGESDLTLQELQQRLWKTRRLALSIGRLWGALRELRLPLKKSRPTPRSKTRRKTGSGGGGGGGGGRRGGPGGRGGGGGG